MPYRLLPPHPVLREMLPVQELSAARSSVPPLGNSPEHLPSARTALVSSYGHLKLSFIVNIGRFQRRHHATLAGNQHVDGGDNKQGECRADNHSAHEHHTDAV